MHFIFTKYKEKTNAFQFTIITLEIYNWKSVLQQGFMVSYWQTSITSFIINCNVLNQARSLNIAVKIYNLT